MGFVLLAVFMGTLISALQALPAAMQAPPRFLAFAVLAAVALTTLLVTERRIKDPLIDLDYTGAVFVRAVTAGSIAMSSILALLALIPHDIAAYRNRDRTHVRAPQGLSPRRHATTSSREISSPAS